MFRQVLIFFIAIAVCPLARAQTTDPEIERLINRLTEVRSIRGDIEQVGFYRVIHRPASEAYIGSSQKENAVQSDIKKLVRLGVRALPGLLNHLQDDRKTKLVLKGKHISGCQYGNAYEPRWDDPRFRPRGTSDSLEVGLEKAEMNYTLRVGDLCYEIIGMIVNRDLYAWSTTWSSEVRVHSPVHNPALAQAVRNDWAYLSKEDHLAQLECDAYSQNTIRSSLAVVRLLSYYPSEGKRIAVRLLKRPLYDWSRVDNDLYRILKKEKDPKKWSAAVRLIERKYGGGLAQLIPRLLEEGNCFVGEDVHHRIPQIQQALYPEYDPYSTEFINAVSTAEQAMLVRQLKDFQLPVLRDAVRNVLRWANSQSGKGRTQGEKTVNDVFITDLKDACCEYIGLSYERDLRDYLVSAGGRSR